MQHASPPIQKYDPGVTSTTVLVDLAMHSADFVVKSHVGFKEDTHSDPDFM